MPFSAAILAGLRSVVVLRSSSLYAG